MNKFTERKKGKKGSRWRRAVAYLFSCWRLSFIIIFKKERKKERK
jgi:hypothetical protein